MRTKARRLQMEKGLKLLIVDYMQLAHAQTRENRVQEVSEISRSLKIMAKELSVPIVALSQLSRACEQREQETAECGVPHGDSPRCSSITRRHA